MKLSTYIDLLQKLLAEHGDLDVMGYNHGSGVLGANREASVPEIKHLAILKGREKTPRFYNKYRDTPDQQGQAVVKVS